MRTAPRLLTPARRLRRRVVLCLQLFQSLGDPQFDQRLTGNAEALRLPVEAMDDPGREVFSLLIQRQVNVAGVSWPLKLNVPLKLFPPKAETDS